MATLALLAPLSLLVERIVNALKSQLTLPDSAKWIWAAIAWIIAVAIAIGMPLDLFAAFGHPFQVPILAQVITGIILGGGSNLTSDLVQLVRAKTPDSPPPACVSTDIPTR